MKKTSPKSAPTVVELNVTQFKNIATEVGFCTVSVGLAKTANPNQHVSLEYGPTGHPYLKCNGKPAALKFSVKGGFKPLGIVFVQAPPADPAQQDPDGSRNFGALKVSATAVTVMNNFRTSLPRGAGGVGYEAYLPVMRVSDQAIGVIDPGIVNEN